MQFAGFKGGFRRLGGLKRKLYPLIFPPVHKEESVQSGFNHILITSFIWIENVQHSGRINKGGKTYTGQLTPTFIYEAIKQDGTVISKHFNRRREERMVVF